MTDNGRAVEDSGIVVSLICRKMVYYQSKYISNATIGRNYMGKTFEFAADCIEECESMPHNSTRIVPRFTISLQQIYRECEIGPCVRKMERQLEIALLLSQISDTPSAIISP